MNTTKFSEVLSIRGGGTASGIIEYLDRIEKRMTDTRLSDTFRLFFGESERDVENFAGKRSEGTYSGLMLPEWLDMGSNIEEWLVYATSIERINYYVNSDEYEDKCKDSRVNFREIRREIRKIYPPGEKRDKETLKMRTKQCIEAVRYKKVDIKRYLVGICEKTGVDTYRDTQFEACFSASLNRAWEQIKFQKKYDIEELNQNRESFHKEKQQQYQLFKDRALSLIGSMPTYTYEETKVLFDNHNKTDSYDRMSIPTSVKQEVWRRDQGSCGRCGSRRNLEYDHIIPVSKGGSNTARNVELLCQDCNRQKSDRIM